MDKPLIIENKQFNKGLYRVVLKIKIWLDLKILKLKEKPQNLILN